MATLNIDAHCVDDEFESSILASYGVRIISMENAPWSVIFEGPREGLRQMYLDNWGDDRDVSDDIVD
jgi:hypothetical protein